MPLATTLLNRIVNVYPTSSDFNGIRANVILGDSRPDALETLKKLVLSTYIQPFEGQKSNDVPFLKVFEQLRKDSSQRVLGLTVAVGTNSLWKGISHLSDLAAEKAILTITSECNWSRIVGISSTILPSSPRTRLYRGARGRGPSCPVGVASRWKADHPPTSAAPSY
jgi:hypothetical protein